MTKNHTIPSLTDVSGCEKQFDDSPYVRWLGYVNAVRSGKRGEQNLTGPESRAFCRWTPEAPGHVITPTTDDSKLMAFFGPLIQVFSARLTISRRALSRIRQLPQ